MTAPLRSAKLVLLVEDHADSGAMMIAVLEDAGYKVQWVRTGTAALAVLLSGQAPRVDVILLDLLLPDMEQDELLTELVRTRQELPPIILSSAKPISVMESAARVLGAAAVLRKPFDIEILLEKLSALFTPAT